jgi:HSP20 family protein
MLRRRPFGFYGYRSPWQDMQRLHQEVDRLFSDSFTMAGGRTAPSYPAINVWTNKDGAVVTAELPGVDADDLDISVVNDTLTLSGERKAEGLEEGNQYHRRERGYGKFNRTFQLPFKVEADNIDALFENGVLHLSLPRAEADKPRKITVKSA